MAPNLSDKKIIASIIIAIIGSGGLSASGMISSTTTNDTMLAHIADESPHAGTSVTLDFLHEDIKQNTNSIDELSKEIRQLHIAICSMKDITCQPEI